MKATVSEKGQTTIPKQVRDSQWIGPRTLLEVERRDADMILRKRNAADPIDSWRGWGRLPVGTSVDEDLKVIRG